MTMETHGLSSSMSRPTSRMIKFPQVFGVLQRGSGHTPLHVPWLPLQGDLPSNAWKGATGCNWRFWQFMQWGNGDVSPCRSFCFSPPARWGLLDFIRAVLLILLLLLRLLRLLLFLLLQFLLDHVCINIHVHFRLANSSPISSPTSARSGHCWTSTAGFRSEWARLDLNRQVLSAVGTAGPQPPVSERSVHRWTSTAGFRAQGAPLDLNLGPSELSGHRWTSTWDLPSSVGTAGPQRPDRMPEDMPDRTPDRMSERMPEDIPDKMPEDMPDRMPEDMPGRMPEGMPDRMSDRMPEGMPNKVPECLPDRTPEDLPDRMPDRMSEDMPEDMPDRVPEDMPEDMPDRMSEDLPEDMPDKMPEDMPEDLPDRMPDWMSEDMPEDMPDRMPDRMPEDIIPHRLAESVPDRMPDRMSEDMPEDMPDRMPEDLPVTKRINLMVGMTRSKVIWNMCWDVCLFCDILWDMRKIRYFGSSNISNNTGHSRTCIFHMLVKDQAAKSPISSGRRWHAALDIQRLSSCCSRLGLGDLGDAHPAMWRCKNVRQWSSLGKGHMVTIKLDQHLILRILLPMVDFLLKHPMEILRR